MRRIVPSLGILAVLTFVLAVSAASHPNFAGKWELDKSKSQSLPRGWQDAESVVLAITQTEKQFTMETMVTGAPPPPAGGPGGGRGFGGGMMGPATYNMDGSENKTESERGTSTSKLAWAKDGMVLELTTSRTFTTPNGEITSTTNDKLTISEDGKTLTIVRHTESPRGSQDSTLVYNKKG